MDCLYVTRISALNFSFRSLKIAKLAEQGCEYIAIIMINWKWLFLVNTGLELENFQEMEGINILHQNPSSTALKYLNKGNRNTKFWIMFPINWETLSNRYAKYIGILLKTLLVITGISKRNNHIPKEGIMKLRGEELDKCIEKQNHSQWQWEVCRWNMICNWTQSYIF